MAAAAFAAACASARYAACPLELGGAAPAEAFVACRALLLQRYGALVVDDAATFRLQTVWGAVPGEAAERRATVFRDDADELAIVVELRRIRQPLVGLPAWTAPRGDAAAERELAAALRNELSR
ncbi:MAG: hypothetical protein JNL08_12485 [Planctomycetes bacterium]|nr:hypothetical protein [Planctomycetota bacterium]